MALSDREKAIFIVGWHLARGGSFSNGARDAVLASATTYTGASTTSLVGEVTSSLTDVAGVIMMAGGTAGAPVEVWN